MRAEDRKVITESVMEKHNLQTYPKRMLQRFTIVASLLSALVSLKASREP